MPTVTRDNVTTKKTKTEASWLESWRAPARRALVTIIVLGIVSFVAMLFGSTEKPKSKSWSFVETSSSEPMDFGLVTESASGGTWTLEDHEEATGGRALANHEGEPDAQPAVLLSKQTRARDLRAKTRCKVAAPARATNDPSASDRSACGIVFRWVDAQNHWIARADVASGSVEVLTVHGNIPRLVGRAKSASVLELDAWIDLGVEVRGDVIRVSVDGRPTLTAEAPLVPAAFGAAGLWAPSEARVFFDDLTIETLIPAPQALETLPLLGKGAQT